jgi:hypothetical protein
MKQVSSEGVSNAESLERLSKEIANLREDSRKLLEGLSAYRKHRLTDSTHYTNQAAKYSRSVTRVIVAAEESVREQNAD